MDGYTKNRGLTRVNLSATMYLTLHDLSTQRFLKVSRMWILFSSGDRVSAMEIKSSTVNNLTES